MDTAAQDYLADPRFNRSVELAGINGQQAFQITYADFGYRNELNPDEERVLLFFGPMFASRFIHVAKDEMAKRHGIRIISIDRPAIGGTQAVEVGKRLDVTKGGYFLSSISRSKQRAYSPIISEMTIALLKHLDINHVSIACHSGGSVYALDLLLHHPEILHPEQPYLAVGAPWAHPAHSGVMAMRITNMLPRSAIGSIDKIATLFMNVQPVLGPAKGLFSGISQYVSGVSSKTRPASADDDEAIKFETELQGKLLTHMHQQGIEGIADEAIMLMQRVDDGSKGWGEWGDYDKLLPQLSATLRAAGRKLTVRSFWAESDGIIGNAGTAGPRWLEQCIQKETRDRDAVISYSSCVITGAEHDTAWDIKFGVPQSVFRDISGKDPAVSEGIA